MIANIVKGASFAGCTKYAYGKDQAEVIDFKDIIPDNHIIAAKCFEHQAQMNKLTSYGIRADIRFRSGTTIPQGICFTKYGTTFKGSSLDRTLSFSQIDKTLSGGINVEWCSQEEHKSMRESQSNDQNISLMANLSGIASDLIVGMLDSGVGGRSEEQDMRPRKKKGMRM